MAQLQTGVMWVGTQARNHKKALGISTPKFVICLPVGGGSKIRQLFKIEYDQFFSLGWQMRGKGLKILEIPSNPQEPKQFRRLGGA